MATRLSWLALLAMLAGMLASCDKEKDPQEPVPPQAPDLLSAISRTDTTIELSWNDRSPDEDGFVLHTEHNDILVRVDTVGANVIRYTVRSLIPGTLYRFKLWSFSAAGSSTSAAQFETQTTGFPPPDPPTNIQAEVIALNVVQVRWSRVGTPESYMIGRRTTMSSWATITTRPASDSSYADSAVGPLTSYYYRVGAEIQNVIAWSADSAFVSTPDGPPFAPDSLTAEAIVGTGVLLHWLDRSDNETGFHIRRDDEIIDSVGANVTSYVDSLGDDIGQYNYRVRAFNELGVSLWTASTNIHYSFCSMGIIPICVGNWWRYTITDTIGSDRLVHRHVMNVAYPTGLDFYLFGQWEAIPQAPTDTLYYLRNFADGCRMINYPSDNNVQMLYKYPAFVGERYTVGTDTMLVASTSTDIEVNGELYNDCYVYQRQIPDEFLHVVTIYVKPYTTNPFPMGGVVFEEERYNDEVVARRSLSSFSVQTP